MKTKFFLVMGLFFSVSATAHAEVTMLDESAIEYTPAAIEDSTTDWTQPYAVLGRGVKNRKTGTILQLACKTEPVMNADGELQCAEVQFIEVDLSGNVREMSRTLRLGVDFNSTSEFKKMLKQRVKALKKSGELPGHELFSSTKNWFTHVQNPGTKILPILLGGGAAFLLASGGAPVLSVIGIGLFGAFPIGIDVVLIPLGLSVNAIKGDYFIGNKTLAVYGWVKDRDPKYWQFKPRGLSPKNYERFKKIVSSDPKLVRKVRSFVSEESNGHEVIRVEVVNLDGTFETIERPSHLVIYAKGGERREYGADSSRVD